MKVIEKGDCYNQILKIKYTGESYSTLEEPDKTSVLNTFAGMPAQPIFQHINYYLCKTNAGWIFTYGDPLFSNFEYYKYVDWLRQQYENKQFSWQKEDLK